MYVAMNHFRIAAGRGDEFEEIWRRRESHLEGVPGFREFHLLRGEPGDDGVIPFASHSVWESQAAFQDWTQSESFRKAHSRGRTPEGLVLGPPRFVGWSAVEL